MPYNPTEQTIKTKLFGVTLKVEDIGRQQFLMMMRDRPEDFLTVKVFGTTCYVTYQDKDYVLGRIKENYSSLLNSHDCKVKSWMVTGGYPIEQADGNMETATMGLNLTIQLTSRVKKEKPIFVENITSDVTRWNG